MESLSRTARWIVGCLVITWVNSNTLRRGESLDYCQWESFNATCGPGEVVAMSTARYGRMRVGRCVSKEYGYVGCYDDTRVLNYVDSRCSGRRRCNFPIADLLLEGFRPCPKDVTPYFEASFTCIRVVTSEHTACSGHMGALLPAPSGFIASSVSENSRQGTSLCPWHIQVQPGQRINITLYDFGVWIRQGESPGRALYCHKYAMIHEGSPAQDTTICAATDRVKTVFVSKGNSVQVTIQSLIGEDDPPKFLLKYEAIGCPRIRIPTKAELTMKGESATVTCALTKEVWHLRCDGNKWTGTMGNCTASKKSTVWSSLFSDGWSTSHGIMIVVGLGITLGVLIGILMLILAVICLRRRGYSVGCNRESLPEPEELVPQPHYEIKYGGTGSSVKAYNTSSGYSSEALLSDTVLVDPRMGNYGDSRLVWAPAPLQSTLNRPTGRRSSQQSMGHIYESPDFTKNDSLVPKDS